MGFARRLGHGGFYGTLRLVVTRNRHGDLELLATNDLGGDLTTIVRRKGSRWSADMVQSQIGNFGSQRPQSSSFCRDGPVPGQTARDRVDS